MVDPLSGDITPGADLAPCPAVLALAADCDAHANNEPVSAALARWSLESDLSTLPGFSTARDLDEPWSPPETEGFAPWPIAAAWTSDSLEECLAKVAEDCGDAYPEKSPHRAAALATAIAIRRVLEGASAESILDDIRSRAFDILTSREPMLRAVATGLKAGLEATSFANAMAQAKLPEDLQPMQPCASFVAGLVCEPRVDMPPWGYLLALDHAGDEFIYAIAALETAMDGRRYPASPLAEKAAPEVEVAIDEAPSQGFARRMLNRLRLGRYATRGN